MPLRPTTDLEVIEAGAPAKLTLPRVPRSVVAVALLVVALVVVVPAIRQSVGAGTFRRIDARWQTAKLDLEDRARRIARLQSLPEDERDLATAEVLGASADRLARLAGQRGGWGTRFDADVRRLDAAVRDALTLEVERLRAAASSYRDHWSAGVSPCCAAAANAKLRVERMLTELRPRYSN